MAGIHAIIGIGEGLITVGALAFIYAARPDLLKKGETGTVHGKMGLGGGFGHCPVLGDCLAAGLLRTRMGWNGWRSRRVFWMQPKDLFIKSIPDYVLPGVSNQSLATILAGVVGVILVFGVAFGVAYSRRKRQAKG